MQIVDIERTFKYNSVTLPDPNPEMSVDQVREMYAAQYPELLNAVVEGPVTKDHVSTYTFTRAAGAKGADREAQAGVAAAEIIVRVSRPVPPGSADALSNAAAQGQFAKPSSLIAQVALNKGNTSSAMLMPSEAFGIWG
jgi:PRTRC genetic system protein C